MEPEPCDEDIFYYVEIHNELVRLTHANTRLKVFKSPLATHLEYQLPDGTVRCGYVSRHLWKQLAWRRFPSSMESTVDSVTMAWLIDDLNLDLELFELGHITEA